MLPTNSSLPHDMDSIVLLLSALAFGGTLSPSGNEQAVYSLLRSSISFCSVFPFSARLNGYLFSAHMVQHILFVLLIPALLLLRLPRSFSFVLPSTI